MQEQPNSADEFEASINEGNQNQTVAERSAETREPMREGRADTIPESKQSEPQDSQNTVPREAREDGNQFPRRQRPDNPADSIYPAQQFRITLRTTEATMVMEEYKDSNGEATKDTRHTTIRDQPIMGEGT